MSKHLPRIIIEAIPMRDQRYQTCGDYYEDFLGRWQLKISKSEKDYEFLILMHELTEFYLTQKRGIPEEDITMFDTMFEEERAKGKWTDEEPGNDVRAPYRKEHKFAEKIERLIAKELGVSWKKYEDTLNKL